MQLLVVQLKTGFSLFYLALWLHFFQHFWRQFWLAGSVKMTKNRRKKKAILLRKQLKLHRNQVLTTGPSLTRKSRCILQSKLPRTIVKKMTGNQWDRTFVRVQNGARTVVNIVCSLLHYVPSELFAFKPLNQCLLTRHRQIWGFLFVLVETTK